jgi:uncharacterized membrane protein YsdA (DUF1294 family)
VTRDEKGRARALEVQFVISARRLSLGAVGPGRLAAVTTFLVFLAAGVLTSRVPIFVPVVYVCASVISCLAYAVDKGRATSKEWRISESALHLLSLAGGWPGALVAQRVWRHKTRKTSFQVVYWITVVVNVAAFAIFASPVATRELLSLGYGRW